MHSNNLYIVYSYKLLNMPTVANVYVFFLRREFP